MKLKIVNCTDKKFWYYSRIGEVFNVLETKTIDSEKCHIVHIKRNASLFVLDSDCITFEDEKDTTKHLLNKNGQLENDGAYAD